MRVCVYIYIYIYTHIRASYALRSRDIFNKALPFFPLLCLIFSLINRHHPYTIKKNREEN